MKPKKPKEPFKVLKSGYKFHKRLFQVTLILVIVFLSVVIFINGANPKYYYSCSESSLPCDLTAFQVEFCSKDFFLENLKYKGLDEWLEHSGLCVMEVAQPGFSFGVPPGRFQGSENFFSFIIVFLAFIYNHFKFNKHFKIIGGS